MTRIHIGFDSSLMEEGADADNARVYVESDNSEAPVIASLAEQEAKEAAERQAAERKAAEEAARLQAEGARATQDRRLRDAAPMMLAALERLVRDADAEPNGEYLQGANRGCVAVNRRGIEAARAAIAAATTEGMAS